MGREIKFREWDGELMHEDVVVVNGEGFKNEKYVGKPIQFTGLHDKNGNEIYEGDIVEVTNPETNKTFVYKVGFNQGCFTFNGWLAREVFNMVTVCEVIGNIYENPELVGEQNERD